MIELVGIRLVVQGGGGLPNRLLGAHSPSWFVQLHVLPPSLHIAVSVALPDGRPCRTTCRTTDRRITGPSRITRPTGRPGPPDHRP